MTSPARFSIDDFATWEPALRLLRDANASALDAPGGYVCGYIGHDSSSVPFRRLSPRQLGRSLQVPDMQEEHDAVQTVRAALTAAGIDGISFKSEISANGHALLRLFRWPPTAQPAIGLGGYPGTLLRHEGAVPAPALPGHRRKRSARRRPGSACRCPANSGRSTR